MLSLCLSLLLPAAAFGQTGGLSPRSSAPQTRGLVAKSGTPASPGLAWVRQLATHENATSDWSYDAVVDRDGNSYITGSSSGLGTSEDFSTAKLDTAGRTVWTIRRDGTGHYIDRATSIALDSSGSAYVSGLGYRSDGSIEFATMKINTATGGSEWTRSIQRDGLFYYTVKVCVDPSGNALVVGSRFLSWESGIFQWSVVSYAPDGQERWTREIDNTGHIMKVLSDPSGNLTIVGQGAPNGFRSQIVKLGPSGELLWTKLVVPLLSTGLSDGYGGLLVTGGTSSNFDSRLYVGALDSTGAFRWEDWDSTIAPSTSGSALARDAEGAYRVAAITNEGAPNVTLLAYDPAGQRLWSHTTSDLPTDIGTTAHLTMSASGESFLGVVTYYHYLLVRYDPGGAYLGSTFLPGGTFSAGGFDPEGFFHAAGTFYDSASQNTDFGSARFAHDGTYLGTGRYEDHTSTWDMACGMAVDGAGNIYVGAHSSSGGSSMLTAWKVDAASNVLWVGREDEGKVSLQSSGLAIDSSGNTIVIAARYVEATGNDYLVVKFDTGGHVLWRTQYAYTPGQYSEWPHAVAADAFGNIYVTGFSSIVPGWPFGGTFLTLKLSPSGEVLWARRRPGNGNSNPDRASLRLGRDGGVYVSGSAIGSDGQYDVSVVRYDSAGSETWASLYVAGNAHEEYTAAMTIDDSSNVICAGWTRGGRGSIADPADFLVTKFGTDGQLRWAARLDTTSVDQFVAVAADHAGGIVAAGQVWTEGHLPDFAIARFDNGGNLLWQSAVPDFPSVTGDVPTLLALDAAGNIAITGYTYVASDTRDLDIGAYSSAGDILWLAGFEGMYYGDDDPVAQIVGPDGSLYVLETNYVQYQNYFLTSLLKFAPGSLAGVGEIPPPVRRPAGVSAPTAWPNPFNGSTTISYDLPARAPVSIRIYDLLGQEVALLFEGEAGPGPRSIRWSPGNAPSGIYLCRVQSGQGSAWLKLSIVK